MQRTETTHAFLSEIVAELGAMPRLALVCFGGIGALSASLDLAFWLHRPRLEPLDYLGIALLLGVSLLATYAASMKMVECRWSYGGLARFLATALAMLSPILLALVFIGLAPGNQLWLAASLAASLLSIVFLSFLPGWPILQATSPRIVGPWAAFKATKGLRWQLFLVSSLTASLNKAVPSMSTAEDIAGAGLLAALGGVVTCFSLMLAAAIAVSAWKHMTSEARDFG
jgi:hypothetical protein